MLNSDRSFKLNVSKLSQASLSSCGLQLCLRQPEHAVIRVYGEQKLTDIDMQNLF